MLDKAFVLKFIKFGLVGGSGVLIDFFFTWLAKEKFKIQKYVSNAIGFMMQPIVSITKVLIITFKFHQTL